MNWTLKLGLLEESPFAIDRVELANAGHGLGLSNLQANSAG